tara:strand:- start:270 stop:1232 length:963 start_codon:yes stop_codon:yes gene_type:complete
VELLREGYEVAVVDNLSNSAMSIIHAVGAVAGAEPIFHHCDLLDRVELSRLFCEFAPDVVIHFAGLKSVVESTERPLDYFDVNVYGTINVLRAMADCGCSLMIFSSSATVYGEPVYIPCDEGHPTDPANPYGVSKLLAEKVIAEWALSNDANSAIIFRYFNPVGAHVSGKLGEDPTGPANNLMPVILDIVSGKREVLEIYGNDYNTVDGTGVRDFIHVMDLARAHVLGIEHLSEVQDSEIFNLGTGQPTSVMQLVSAFEEVSGQKVNVKFVGRRLGDVGEVWTSNASAKKILGFETRFSLHDMCAHAYQWIKRNASTSNK